MRSTLLLVVASALTSYRAVDETGRVLRARASPEELAKKIKDLRAAAVEKNQEADALAGQAQTKEKGEEEAKKEKDAEAAKAAEANKAAEAKKAEEARLRSPKELSGEVSKCIKEANDQEHALETKIGAYEKVKAQLLSIAQQGIELHDAVAELTQRTITGDTQAISDATVALTTAQSEHTDVLTQAAHEQSAAATGTMDDAAPSQNAKTDDEEQALKASEQEKATDVANGQKAKAHAEEVLKKDQAELAKNEAELRRIADELAATKAEATELLEEITDRVGKVTSQRLQCAQLLHDVNTADARRLGELTTANTNLQLLRVSDENTWGRLVGLKPPSLRDQPALGEHSEHGYGSDELNVPHKGGK